jgi:hypothetical protein
MSPPRRRFGETWTYESIVGAIPGLSLPPAVAVTVQFALFEAGVLVLAAVYDLPGAVLPGTVAVGVAAVGSAFMLDLGERTRRLDLAGAYDRLLFGSRIEVVLTLLAFSALLTYLFVADPRTAPVLLYDLLGERPPLPAVYLTLLVLWDVCYRIGTGWWTAVVACWRSLAGDFDARTAAELRRIDRRTAGFAVVQLALVPFVRGHPVLTVALVGHVVAVGAVTGLSTLLLARKNGN